MLNDLQGGALRPGAESILCAGLPPAVPSLWGEESLRPRGPTLSELASSFSCNHILGTWNPGILCPVVPLGAEDTSPRASVHRPRPVVAVQAAGVDTAETN